MAPQFPPMHHPFGAASVSHLVFFPIVRGPEDMMSSPQGPHLSYEAPRGFVMPPFSMYDGSTDPYDHMLRFNQTMILSAGNDRLLCKVSLASLKGPTLAWFHKLPRGSINSFSELWAEFISQYLCSARQKGNIGSLQAILKREDESIRDFTKDLDKLFNKLILQHGHGLAELSKKLRANYPFLSVSIPGFAYKNERIVSAGRQVFHTRG